MTPLEVYTSDVPVMLSLKQAPHSRLLVCVACIPKVPKVAFQHNYFNRIQPQMADYHKGSRMCTKCGEPLFTGEQLKVRFLP